MKQFHHSEPKSPQKNRFRRCTTRGVQPRSLTVEERKELVEQGAGRKETPGPIRLQGLPPDGGKSSELRGFSLHEGQSGKKARERASPARKDVHRPQRWWERSFPGGQSRDKFRVSMSPPNSFTGREVDPYPPPRYTELETEDPARQKGGGEGQFFG